MLRNSFIQFSGVGGKTEAKLWQDGIRSWDAYLAQSEPPLGKRSHEKVLDGIKTSQEALAAGNLDHFKGEYFPREEAWRAFGEFKDKSVYLDALTIGSGTAQARLALIGMYDGKSYREYNAETGMEKFAADFAGCVGVVTFQGSSTFLPLLQKALGQKVLDKVAMEIRHPLKHLGFSGTAASIEKQIDLLALHAPEELDGAEVQALCDAARDGNSHAGKSLSRSLEQGVRLLAPLMDYAYLRAFEELLPNEEHDEALIATAATLAPAAVEVSAPGAPDIEPASAEGFRYPRPKRMRSPIETGSQSLAGFTDGNTKSRRGSVDNGNSKFSARPKRRR